MNFVELTEKEFNTFFKKHPLSTFLQSPHFNAADELENWKIVYLGVKKGKKVIKRPILQKIKIKINTIQVI